jgi:HPt (histidine-containing phosphotransfer) domain-containing protein
LNENVLDAAAIESLRELGGEELVAEVRNIFVAEIPALISGVEDAARRGQADAMWKAAHAIRSIAANAGATRLALLCDTVQERGYAGSVEGADELVQQLWAEFDRARAALEAIS